jgi:hypothetical protein
VALLCFYWVHSMPPEPSDPIAALPPYVSVTRTAAVLCISRATVWRRIKDGTLERVGTGKITKKSIERLVAPRSTEGAVS